MAVCKGCGVRLQTTDKNAVGYTPKENSDYCQRCFRLIHYDDLTVSMKKGIDPDTVLTRIAEIDGMILWLVDVFDFEAGMIAGLNRKTNHKDIVMVLTKRDLLPDTVSHEKLAQFAFSRLKEYGISIRELILSGKDEDMGCDEIKDAVRRYSNGKPVVVMGRANAGKSTLLNRLMQSERLTMSRHPGTTLDFNQIEIDGTAYIDTPGIEIEGSILMETREEDLKQIVPARPVKPMIFQIRGNQSFVIGGLCRIDLFGCSNASAVFYLSDSLSIHRGKAENADALWDKHYGKLLVPVPVHNRFKSHTARKTEKKTDVVIDGLGWVCLSGEVKTITVKAPETVNITFRKGMI